MGGRGDAPLTQMKPRRELHPTGWAGGQILSFKFNALAWENPERIHVGGGITSASTRIGSSGQVDTLLTTSSCRR